MEEKAICAIHDIISSYELIYKSRCLVVCLCLFLDFKEDVFLDIKEAKYYVMESLMIILPMQELKLEGEVHCKEFGFV